MIGALIGGLVVGGLWGNCACERRHEFDRFDRWDRCDRGHGWNDMRHDFCCRRECACGRHRGCGRCGFGW